ncbi:hypothetical protein SAMN05661096_01036 [Marivirga sericea]|uniref:Uncharacterized protein n=1 Tax=Marivirga sericea TaxID=1028 RepID=A0A1X7ISN7_9BACT|nr:hypothetical protein [Marivirga sericea]SMG18203.1 hypothetical protein SAMN05661096_01036 [Marivirga sericea]
MIFNLESINEILEASQVGAKKNDSPLWTNSEELEKYMKTSTGINFSITDIEGIIRPKKSEFSTLKNLEPKPTILERLGVNIWDSSMSGVDGIKAPNLANLDFEFVNEGEEAQDGVNAVPHLQYRNNFVTGIVELQKPNFIGKTPEEINQWLLIETKRAIHEAIFKKLVSKITALSAVSGYTSIDTAKTYSLADFNALEQANTGDYSELKYLVSSFTARKLKTTDSGYNQPLLANRLVNDIQTYVRKEVANDCVILGDFSKVGIMVHGMNIFTDQYTKMNDGILQMRVISHCDLHLLDNSAFTTGKNFE